MPRAGLTRQSIQEAALRLIEERGNRVFSLNELSRSLNVKASSLYNHFRDMEELTGEVGYLIGQRIGQTMTDAARGKSRDEALRALCQAYRTFAKEHMDLYKVIMGMQKDKNAHTERACGELMRPILEVLHTYRLKADELPHIQRMLRAVMHGFITHEYAGGFSHSEASAEDSFRFAVEGIILVLHTKETEADV